MSLFIQQCVKKVTKCIFLFDILKLTKKYIKAISKYFETKKENLSINHLLFCKQSENLLSLFIIIKDVWWDYFNENSL